MSNDGYECPICGLKHFEAGVLSNHMMANHDARVTSIELHYKVNYVVTVPRYK